MGRGGVEGVERGELSVEGAALQVHVRVLSMRATTASRAKRGELNVARWVLDRS